jgi:hypothetical protein
MYYLQHDTDDVRITCNNYASAMRMLYLQWRLPDGSIPWTLVVTS